MRLTRPNQRFAQVNQRFASCWSPITLFASCFHRWGAPSETNVCHQKYNPYRSKVLSPPTFLVSSILLIARRNFLTPAWRRLHHRSSPLRLPRRFPTPAWAGGSAENYDSVYAMFHPSDRSSTDGSTRSKLAVMTCCAGSGTAQIQPRKHAPSKSMKILRLLPGNIS